VNLPKPAVNQKVYFASQTSCPPTDPGSFVAINSYPFVCMPLSDTEALMYGCSDTAWTTDYYMNTDCSGDPFYTYDVLALGCSAESGSVTVTECNADSRLSEAPKATKAPAPPPAVEAKLRAFFEKRALLAEADEKRTADVLAAIKVHQ